MKYAQSIYLLQVLTQLCYQGLSSQASNRQRRRDNLYCAYGELLFVLAI